MKPLPLQRFNMEYSIADIKNILGADGQLVSRDDIIEFLLTDSRTMHFPKPGLFIAIKGRQHDGNKYIKQVYDAGGRNFIVQQIPLDVPVENCNLLLVKNSVDALQKIAIHHRNQFKIPVIGITGSNGKTIVKEWLFHILKSHYNICRSPKSYNSQIGVPLSVWQLRAQNELGIFEAGISLPGEMERLEKIIKPTMGIFTNIGPAHDEGFESTEQKIKEKAKLFLNSNLIIYCCDDDKIHAELKLFPSKKITWSQNNLPSADVHIKKVERSADKTFFELQWNALLHHFEIPFSDEASLENAVHAVIASLHLDIEIELLRSALKELPPVSMRLELKRGINNSYIINDVYSADIGSLEIALHFLNRQKNKTHAKQKTHVVLSDIEGSGESGFNLYTKVAALIMENEIDEFTGIGNAISNEKNVFLQIKNLQSHFYPSTDAFINQLNEDDFYNRVILLKGARSFQLERISNMLAEKTHGTVLKIYLNHLVHNLNTYRALLHPGVKVMAMVKAFSYGSGTVEIANVLAFNHADYLAVAYTDEGVELRKQGIHLPVMVMNPEPDTFEQLIQYRLEPEIYNFRILYALLQFLKNKNAGKQAIIPVHIKLDTGMHRLGFEENNTDELIALIKTQPEIKIATVFSHLSSADIKTEHAFTRQQIKQFKKLSEKIIHAFDYTILRHILNSSGIPDYFDAQFDMVRLGIGLYGIDPSQNMQDKLLFVSSLHTTVSQIKDIVAGDSVSYRRAFIAEKAMRIATLNIGYADGFRRSLGNGVGSVWIKNNLAPVLGNVCMDMLIVDVTHIKTVQEGDDAEIFGEHISILDYALRMQTIPYEVMTSISQRVKRVYVHE